MSLYTSAQALIGNTPMLALRNIGKLEHLQAQL